MTAGAVSAPLIIPIMHLQTHRAKNHIDTNTPVSIHSDTPGVLIFYTLDGSRPAAVQWGSGVSRKYSEPVLLPVGRVTVRAVGVTRDGRQSSTVTKVFLVELMESTDQNVLQRLSGGTSWSSENPAGSSLRPPEPSMMGNLSPQTGPRFLNSHLGSPRAVAQTGPSQRSQSASSKQLNSTQTSRVNRETDFLRCPQCLGLRPSDPFARFCPQCGASVPPLPQQRAPPAEGGQGVCCVFCNTVVPVNTHTCLICEASVHQQLQPRATHTMQDHVTCSHCGSGNPAHMSHCLTCESHLQPALVNSAPSGPSADCRMASCSRCKRLNQRDARFCDWCGSKPSHAARSVTCWRCGASGHPYAFYCAACGIFQEAPAPPTTSSDIVWPAGGVTANQVLPTSDHAPKVTTPTAEQCTQTVGLYYPSATELQRKEQQRAQGSRDRQPLLTAISPGRGFWRKQVDHVCAHLQSYAQNNTPFRTLLGEPRLGRMVSAVIREDPHEVSLTISFVSVERDQKQVFHRKASWSQVGTVGLTADRSITEGPADRDGPSKSQVALAGMKKPSKPNLAAKPPVKDLELLKELGPGRGQVSVVQQLLDQGADPSCCSGRGQCALAIAAANGHHDVLPVLVQRGADVDRQSGPMKNSALHEAAARGSEGLRCARVLLSCRASARRRNASGQTVFDVALKSGCHEMVSLLAAQTSLDLLGQAKPNMDLF